MFHREHFGKYYFNLLTNTGGLGRGIKLKNKTTDACKKRSKGMKLKNIMQRERSQTQKTHDWMIPFTPSSRTRKTIINAEKDQTSGCLWAADLDMN